MSVIARLRGALRRGGFVRGAVAIALGTGAAQVITVLSAPILTRLYSPSDYGVFSVATSILAVLVSVTCLRYEFAIPLPEDDVAAANVLILSLVLSVVTSIIAAVALWLFGTWLLALFNASVLGPYVLLLALAQAGGGVTSALVNWAVRTKEFSEIAVNRMTQSVVLVGVQIGLGALRSGAPGLVVGAVLGSLAGSWRLAGTAWRTHAPAFRRVTWSGMWLVAKRYYRFPVYSSGSALIGTLGLRAPLLLLVVFYGPGVGGQYALAERVCYLPLTLVAGAVGQVFIAEGARLARNDPAELRRLFRRTTWALAGLAIAPAAIVAVGAPLLAGLVFGDSWRDAGLFVAILVPMFYVAFVATSTGDVLYVLERQRLHLVREIFRLGLLGGSMAAAAALHFSAVGAVSLLSLAGCVTYLIYGVISWQAVASHRPRPQPTFVADPDHPTEVPEIGL